MRKVRLTYFKKSGKYYSDGTYHSDKKYDFEIYKEVREMAEKKQLPGLREGAGIDDFTILVKPYLGVMALIHEKNS